MPKQMTTIVVNGALGRMGKQAVAAINAANDLTLVAATSRQDDLAAILKQHQPDVVVDLTLPDCVYQNCETIINHGCRPVIGTTGLTDQQIVDLGEHCAKRGIGGVIAPNFSIGAVLMMQCAKLVAAHFPEVEIIEAHHPQKIDAPSGTAIKTAQIIAQAHRQHFDQEKSPAPKQSRGETHYGVPIHSLRLPGYIATQKVIFGGQGELLSIEHQSLDRTTFMPGLLLACRKAPELTKLYYGLEHLLGDFTT